LCHTSRRRLRIWQGGHETGVRQETVGKAQEFAHNRNKGKFGRFAARKKTLVKGGKQGIVTTGHERGHVEGFTGMTTTAAYLAGGVAPPAFMSPRREAGKGSHLPVAVLAEFGKVARQTQNRDRTQTDDGKETVMPGTQFGFAFGQFAQLRLEQGGLVFERGRMGFDQAFEFAVVGLLEAVVVLGLEVEELPAAVEEVLEAHNAGGRALVGAGFLLPDEACDERGVEPVGLGEVSVALGEVPDAFGVDAAM